MPRISSSLMIAHIPVFLQQFKFPFVLVPHELEGSLGHATAAAAAAAPADSLGPTIVSLDVGGGSFQVPRISVPMTCNLYIRCDSSKNMSRK